MKTMFGRTYVQETGVWLDGDVESWEFIRKSHEKMIRMVQEVISARPDLAPKHQEHMPDDLPLLALAGALNDIELFCGLMRTLILLKR